MLGRTGLVIRITPGRSTGGRETIRIDLRRGGDSARVRSSIEELLELIRIRFGPSAINTGEKVISKSKLCMHGIVCNFFRKIRIIEGKN